MRENNLSIHIESGNIYYNGLNTGESFYDFVLPQKDITKKKIVTAKIHYGGTFEQCLAEFLASLDADTDFTDITIFFCLED